MNLTQLIDTFRGPLIGLIVSWGDVTEIAQDSFAAAYLNREKCRGDWQQSEVFGRWLRGIARNKYRNWVRTRQRYRAHVTEVDPGVLELVVILCELEPSEQIEKLRSAIDQLPTKQRQVILMHYLEETSVKEVVILLATKPKTIEGRLYQARQSLRRMLDDETTTTKKGKRLLCL